MQSKFLWFAQKYNKIKIKIMADNLQKCIYRSAFVQIIIPYIHYLYEYTSDEYILSFFIIFESKNK